MLTLSRLLVTAIASTALVLAGCNSNNPESQAAEHIERSQVYADQGQYRSAIIELRNAIQKDPESIKSVLQLAEVMLTVGAARQASDMLEGWLSKEPDLVALTLAEAYMQQGKHVSAREALQGFSPGTDQERAQLVSLRADSYRLMGDHRQAISGYQQALNLRPDHVASVTGMARSYMEQGHLNDALSVLGDWIELNGDEPGVLYTKGLVHYQLNELDNAASALTDANSNIPQSDMFLPERRLILSLLTRTLTEQGDITQARIYNNVLVENTDTTVTESADSAISALRVGDLDSARSIIEQLLQTSPDSELGQLLLGAIAVEEGNLEEGASLLLQNLDAEVTPTPFIRLATMAQLNRGERTEALATLERALLARPTSPELLAMHGILSLADPATAEEGIVSLNKAIQIDDGRPRLRLALAQYYLGQGDTEQALGHLRAAFSRTPQDWPVTDFYLSLVLSEELESELNEIRRVLENQFPDEPYSNLLLSLIDYRQGDSDSAIRRLHRLRSEAPAFLTGQLALGRMLEAQGDMDAAIDVYLSAAETDAGSSIAVQQAVRVFARGRDFNSVLNWLDETIEKRPALANSLGAIAAQGQAQQGNLSDAKARISRLDPQYPQVRVVRSNILASEAQQSASEQNWEQVDLLLEEAIGLNPENIQLFLLKVRIEANRNGLDSALTMLDNVAADFGEPRNLVLLRSGLLRSQSGVEAGYRYLKSQFEQSSDYGLMPDMLAMARQADLAEAQVLAADWTTAQPENPLAWQTRADIALTQGNESRASSHYREVLSIQPGNVLALNNLAWTLRDVDPEQAVALAQRANELAPDNAAILDTYGWVLHLAGQHQLALDTLNKALELDPGNPEIEEHLARVQAAQQ